MYEHINKKPIKRITHEVVILDELYTYEYAEVDTMYMQNLK